MSVKELSDRRYWFCLGVWAAFALMRGDFAKWDELNQEARQP